MPRDKDGVRALEVFVLALSHELGLQRNNQALRVRSLKGIATTWTPAAITWTPAAIMRMRFPDATVAFVKRNAALLRPEPWIAPAPPSSVAAAAPRKTSPVRLSETSAYATSSPRCRAAQRRRAAAGACPQLDSGDRNGDGPPKRQRRCGGGLAAAEHSGRCRNPNPIPNA